MTWFPRILSKLTVANCFFDDLFIDYVCLLWEKPKDHSYSAYVCRKMFDYRSFVADLIALNDTCGWLALLLYYIIIIGQLKFDGWWMNRMNLLWDFKTVKMIRDGGWQPSWNQLSNGVPWYLWSWPPSCRGPIWWPSRSGLRIGVDPSTLTSSLSWSE